MLIDDALVILEMERPTRPRNKIECPKHEENTPSLHLYERDFYCYSCGLNGDGYGLIAAMQDRPVADVLKEYGNAEHDAVRQAAAARHKQRKDLMALWYEYENAYLDVLYKVLDDLPKKQQVERITRIYDIIDEIMFDARDMSHDELRTKLRHSLDLLEDKLKQQIELRNVFRGGELDVELPRTELCTEIRKARGSGRSSLRGRRTPRQLGSVRVEAT